MDKQPHIIFSDGFRLLQLALDEICLIETIKGTDKCGIHTVYGRFIIRMRLKAIAEKLDERFVHATRSSIVNKDKIIEVNRTARTLRLRDGTTAPYTRLFTFK